ISEPVGAPALERLLRGCELGMGGNAGFGLGGSARRHPSETASWPRRETTGSGPGGPHAEPPAGHPSHHGVRWRGPREVLVDAGAFQDERLGRPGRIAPGPPSGVIKATAVLRRVRPQHHRVLLSAIIENNGHVLAAEVRVVRLQQRDAHRLLRPYLHGTPQFADVVRSRMTFLVRDA